MEPANNREKYLQNKIKKLLILAEKQLGRMQLTLPIKNNAYETYQQVLKIDKNNNEAKQGIVKIGDRYQKLAEQYAKRGLLRKSLLMTERGLRIVPDHSDLLVQKAVVDTILSQPVTPLAQVASARTGGRLTGYLQAKLEEAEQLRQFPWPPPLASTTHIIPREFLENKQGVTFLRDVYSKISQAIKKTGYYDSSYYAAPKGLAIVTRMEQIEEDGSPKKEPQRWSLESQSLDEFTLAAYLKALFLSKPGYYRVIVFVVTPYSIMQSSVGTTLEEAKKWLSGGHNRLPESIGNMEFLKTYTCTALIYEFERQTESEEPRFRQPGRIPGYLHLVKAGIWRSLEQ